MEETFDMPKSQNQNPSNSGRNKVRPVKYGDQQSNHSKTKEETILQTPLNGNNERKRIMIMEVADSHQKNKKQKTKESEHKEEEPPNDQ